MIDFRGVWLPQIKGYAEQVEGGQLEREWLGLVEVATSITNPEELLEQVFDDLDADGIWAGNRNDSGLSPQAVAAIDDFLAALRNMSETDVSSAVASDAWSSAKRAARAIMVNVN